MLLDEATASLDVENETAVQTALSHLLRGKTVLAEGGLYRRMVELQNESAQWKLGQEAPTKAQ